MGPSPQGLNGAGGDYRSHPEMRSTGCNRLQQDDTSRRMPAVEGKLKLRYFIPTSTDKIWS